VRSRDPDGDKTGAPDPTGHHGGVEMRSTRLCVCFDVGHVAQ